MTTKQALQALQAAKAALKVAKAAEEANEVSNLRPTDWAHFSTLRTDIARLEGQVERMKEAVSTLPTWNKTAIATGRKEIAELNRRIRILKAALRSGKVKAWKPGAAILAAGSGVAAVRQDGKTTVTVLKKDQALCKDAAHEQATACASRLAKAADFLAAVYAEGPEVPEEIERRALAGYARAYDDFNSRIRVKRTTEEARALYCAEEDVQVVLWGANRTEAATEAVAA